jgi:hypothetical protein
MSHPIDREGNGLTIEPPKHRYGTRATNNPHPAGSVGLQRRTRGEISGVAGRKKALENAQEARKLGDKAKRHQKESEGTKKLAALEDERMREEMDEDTYDSPSQRPGANLWMTYMPMDEIGLDECRKD